MMIYPSVSDKAVQAAVKEYQNAISEDLGEWYAMRIAIQAAMAEDKKDESEEMEYMKFVRNAYFMTVFAFIYILMGVIIKTII